MLPTLLDDIDLDEVDKDLSWLTKQKKSTPQLIFVTENIPSATHALVIPHTHTSNETLLLVPSKVVLVLGQPALKVKKITNQEIGEVVPEIQQK